MSSDFEIYNNIVAILFSFYVFLTFTEKKKYISNLAAGFALYLIALSMFVFRELIISGSSPELFFILIKASYFSAPYFIYNAMCEFSGRKTRKIWLISLIVSIAWIIASELLRLYLDLQLIPLLCISATIYFYTAIITFEYRQIGFPLRLLASVVLSVLAVMFLSVLFVETGDAVTFIDKALKSSILVVIALMVVLIMMYFQKIRVILTEQKDQIDYLNYHDEITGLYNRTYFEHCSDLFSEVSNYPLSVIVIDSAALSMVNSAYGIFSNDQVLRDAAQKFGSIKKDNEVIFKSGSEEILVLMLNTGFLDAKDRAADYHRLISGNDSDTKTGFMFGIGSVSEPESEPHRLVEEAMSNMYINKLINNRDYIHNFISYFTTRIHRQEGKSEARLARLKKMAVGLGFRIGLGETEMEYLSRVCDLYDIGKISIPYRILEKKDPLTPEEWDIIRRYPDFSYDIVYTVFGDRTLAEAVRAVRERWDGNGYPLGLSKKKIPEISRVVSIVESFDSMTNSTYGLRRTPLEALDEINRNKGGQFDPAYAAAFIKYINEKISDETEFLQL